MVLNLTFQQTYEERTTSEVCCCFPFVVPGHLVAVAVYIRSGVRPRHLLIIHPCARRAHLGQAGQALSTVQRLGCPFATIHLKEHTSKRKPFRFQRAGGVFFLHTGEMNPWSERCQEMHRGVAIRAPPHSESSQALRTAARKPGQTVLPHKTSRRLAPAGARLHRRLKGLCLWRGQHGCGSKPIVPFWGRCTTHFSPF